MAKTMSETMKLNNSISQCRTVIDSLKRDIGFKYVEVHLDDPDAEFIKEISQIKEELKKIEQYSRKIEQLKTPAPRESNGSVCPKCGASVSEDMLFCMNCGNKLSKGEQMRYCPQCGTQVPGNAKFCISCGTPMDAGKAEPNVELADNEHEETGNDITDNPPDYMDNSGEVKEPINQEDVAVDDSIIEDVEEQKAD